MADVTFAKQSQSINHLFNAILGQHADCRETFGSDISAAADTLDKYELWKANSGSVHPPGSKLSLEERLKNAPQLRNEIHELLKSLEETLLDGVVTRILSGVHENCLIFKETLEQTDDGSAEFEDAAPALVTTTTTELADLMGIASDTIGSLLKLIRFIRKATSRDRHSRALQSQQEPFLDLFDINYVRDRYPKLDKPETQWLIERLGRAITMRRQFLRYSREHNDRLSSLTAINDHSTKASTLDNSRLDISRGQNNVLELDDREDVSSYISVTTSVAVENPGLRLPRVEDIKQRKVKSNEQSKVEDVHQRKNDEEPFECPLCFQIITVKDDRTWRRHAHEDLKPYVCCLGRGQCHLQIFGSQREWFDHELEYHRSQWSCPICKEGPFSKPHTIRTHLVHEHPDFRFSEEAMEALTVAGQHPAGAITAKECPFCDEWQLNLLKSRSRKRRGKSTSDDTQDGDVAVPAINFRRHVALHLEQLAWFAIPKGVLDPTEPSAESHGAQEPRSSRRSLASTFRELELASVKFTSPAHSLSAEERLEPTVQLPVSTQSPEASPKIHEAASTPYRDSLQGKCLEYGWTMPDFQIVSDRRGGRTAWSCIVKVCGTPVKAKFWYDGRNLNNAKEDAAQAALDWLANSGY